MRWLERHLIEGSPRLRHLGELRRGPLQGSRSAANQSILRPVPIYHLHDTAGDDLGLLEHPATNVEPGDVVHLADGREALVTTRAETNDEAIWALLEVLVAPSSPHIPTWRAVDFPGPS